MTTCGRCCGRDPGIEWEGGQRGLQSHYRDPACAGSLEDGDGEGWHRHAVVTSFPRRETKRPQKPEESNPRRGACSLSCTNPLIAPPTSPGPLLQLSLPPLPALESKRPPTASHSFLLPLTFRSDSRELERGRRIRTAQLEGSPSGSLVSSGAGKGSPDASRIWNQYLSQLKTCLCSGGEEAKLHCVPTGCQTGAGRLTDLTTTPSAVRSAEPGGGWEMGQGSRVERGRQCPTRWV